MLLVSATFLRWRNEGVGFGLHILDCAIGVIAFAILCSLVVWLAGHSPPLALRTADSRFLQPSQKSNDVSPLKLHEP